MFWLSLDKRLDMINDAGVASTSVYLANKKDYLGQLCTILSRRNGSWRLINNFTGPDKHLNVYSNTKEDFWVSTITPASIGI